MTWDFLPDLANKTPLWLALVTAGVNAAVAAHYIAHGLGIETQRVDRPATLLFTRKRDEQ